MPAGRHRTHSESSKHYSSGTPHAPLHEPLLVGIPEEGGKRFWKQGPDTGFPEAAWHLGVGFRVFQHKVWRLCAASSKHVNEGHESPSSVGKESQEYQRGMSSHTYMARPSNDSVLLKSCEGGNTGIPSVQGNRGKHPGQQCSFSTWRHYLKNSVASCLDASFICMQSAHKASGFHFAC